MSNEILAVILSALGLLVILGGSATAGLSWVVRRIDASETRLTRRIDAVDTRLSDRIDTVDTKLSDRIDALDAKFSDLIDRLQVEVTEVKIAVARIEGGSRPPLILTR